MQLIIPIAVIILLASQKGKATSNTGQTTWTFDSRLVSPLSSFSLRNDPKGAGHFGAPRGSRKHNGIDLIAKKNQLVYSPIDGQIVRIAKPYGSDPKYSGVLIEGRGLFKNVAFKMFYMTPLKIGINVVRGQSIGIMQDISEKYGPQMKPHLHIEMYINGRLVDPYPYLTNQISLT